MQNVRRCFYACAFRAFFFFFMCMCTRSESRVTRCHFKLGGGGPCKVGAFHLQRFLNKFLHAASFTCSEEEKTPCPEQEKERNRGEEKERSEGGEVANSCMKSGFPCFTI